MLDKDIIRDVSEQWMPKSERKPSTKLQRKKRKIIVRVKGVNTKSDHPH
jgi:hypothetical protein